MRAGRDRGGSASRVVRKRIAGTGITIRAPDLRLGQGKVRDGTATCVTSGKHKHKQRTTTTAATLVTLVTLARRYGRRRRGRGKRECLCDERVWGGGRKNGNKASGKCAGRQRAPIYIGLFESVRCIQAFARFLIKPSISLAFYANAASSSGWARLPGWARLQVGFQVGLRCVPSAGTRFVPNPPKSSF